MKNIACEHGIRYPHITADLRTKCNGLRAWRTADSHLELFIRIPKVYQDAPSNIASFYSLWNFASTFVRVLVYVAHFATIPVLLILTSCCKIYSIYFISKCKVILTYYSTMIKLCQNSYTRLYKFIICVYSVLWNIR